MTERYFRLTEIHHKIDDRLRFERFRGAPHPRAISRLARLKRRVKQLIARALPRAA